jgi:hypothetical protein
VKIANEPITCEVALQATRRQRPLELSEWTDVDEVPFQFKFAL